jgi:hypothetical protein
VSNTEKIFGVVKSVMLMHERFDGLDERVKRLDGDLTDLARSHSTLAQRVAEMEGYLRAATRTPFGDRPGIEHK